MRDQASRGPSEPLDWAASAGAVSDVLQEMHLRLRRKRVRRVKLAAGCFAAALACLAVAWPVATRQPARVTLPPSAVVTLPARQLLPDGSVIELRNDARVVVNYTERQRCVMLEKGEAYFQVAREAGRPFVVMVQGLEFRAIGTAFTVQLGEGRIEVLVTEGRVAVDKFAESPQRTVEPLPRASLAIVEAGNRVLIEAEDHREAPVVESVPEFELNRRLAWRAPKLELTATPLAEAVELINRHAGAETGIQLVIGDPALAEIRLTGVLRADNIDTLLAVLKEDHGIRAELRGGEMMLLPRR